MRIFPILFPALVVALSLSQDLLALEPYRIQVIDAENGWPVPLVELRTTHHVRFVSDNAGNIAFDLPELMGVETWFTVIGHGYSVPVDGFGYQGVRLVPQPGATGTVKVTRALPAKRLGRITGAGIFAESQKLGEFLDWKEQGILGCDSVQNAVHQGKLFWGWGDTVLPHYPLGRFHMIGATTPRQPLKRFRPPIELSYDYFTDVKNVPRNVAKLPGSGPTWLGGFISLPDAKGQMRLVATYAKIDPPLSEYERGLCVWNESEQRFDPLKKIWTRTDSHPTPPITPHGHPVHWQDDRGKQWILFGDPFPNIRCEATFEAWSDPQRWELITPQETVPARDSQSKVRPHRGAIAWHKHRGKWVTVFTQFGGQASHLGELWYAESDSPLGPWEDAVLVVTHQKYTFYNPQLHPEFTDADASFLLFEATYTHTFSQTPRPTPRHDYNQVLYRLDLEELNETPN